MNAVGQDTCTGSGPVFARYETDSTFPIEIGSTGSLGMSGSSFSATAWVYLTTHDQGDQAIFGSVVGRGGNRAMHLQVRNGQYYMGFYANDCSGGASVLNEWQYAVFVYDFPTRRQMIYVDGELMNTCENKAPLEGDDGVLLGSWAHTRHWEGQIKEAKIYDYALTPDAVNDMYNRGSGQCYMWNNRAWKGQACLPPHFTVCGCTVCEPCDERRRLEFEAPESETPAEAAAAPLL